MAIRTIVMRRGGPVWLRRKTGYAGADDPARRCALGLSGAEQQITANQAAAEDFIRKDKQVEKENIVKGVGSAISFSDIAGPV